MTRKVSKFDSWRWLTIIAAVLLGAVSAATTQAEPTEALSSATSPNIRRGPASVAMPMPDSAKVAAELGLGRWIWTTNFTDAQQVRFWRTFTLPATNLVSKANLRITADDSYHLYFDGREIAQGANWHRLIDYDLTWLMSPGTHVLAIDTFNDGFEGGLILGLKMTYADGQHAEILSDRSWYIVPNEARSWSTRTHPDPKWTEAREVGVVGQNPWTIKWPFVFSPPPLRPVELHFWQTAWFLATVLGVCVVALGLSAWLATKLAVQNNAQKLMVRERMLIARDIHDDLGSSLTQLVLQGEVAQTELPDSSPAKAHLDVLCDRARNASQALDEVLWAVNSKRDTLRDFSSYMCKYAQSFLSPTSIRCRLDIQPDMPTCDFDLPVRRGLFLAVKEALNNAARHSGATELFLRISRNGEMVVVRVEDNGRGFDATLRGEDGHGLNNMRQRLAEMGGECNVQAEPGAGCRVEFKMPLAHKAHNESSWWRQIFRSRSKVEVSGLEDELARDNDHRVSET